MIALCTICCGTTQTDALTWQHHFNGAAIQIGSILLNYLCNLTYRDNVYKTVFYKFCVVKSAFCTRS